MWSNNTPINFDNQILFLQYLLKGTCENMLQKQWKSLKIAWRECLSYHTCKMKSCAPPGMHSVCVIHHIMHYQSYNEGFGSTPMLSFLSHSSDIFFPPNNKLSHPFFITQVFQHWSSLKVREAFLWPEGHIVWICQICYENLGGGTERIHNHLHQSALKQHIVLSLQCSCSGQFVIVSQQKLRPKILWNS